MGCNESHTIADSDLDQSLIFQEMVAKGNPLACAIARNWCDFVHQNECRVMGDVLEAECSRGLTKYIVHINGSPEEARKQLLTYHEAQLVAHAFMGFVVDSLAGKNWGGSIQHTLKGAPGKESVLSFTGCALYKDAESLQVTCPYTAKFVFYLCGSGRVKQIAA